MSTTKVGTGKVRLSYAFLFEARAPRENPEGEKKFSTSILIPKTDKETLAKIKEAQEAAITAKWPGKRPAKIASTLHGGDGVKEKTGEPYGPECKGHYVMAVSSKLRPGVVDTNMNKIIDSSEISSGDYARVSINAYAYDVSGNRGVSFGLGNVQLLAKGEPLGGSTRAEDDFTAVDDDFLS